MIEMARLRINWLLDKIALKINFADAIYCIASSKVRTGLVLAASEIDEQLSALERGECLSAEWYTDPAIAAQETEKIFRRSWQYVTHGAQVANTGDFVATSIADVPIVVIRNDSGLQAFVNVCRHRRHEVMNGCGNAKIMQCPYHAWRYDLTGALKAAPRSEREDEFDLQDYPLLPVRVEELGPWVFVNLDSTADPIAVQFGSVLAQIAAAGIDIGVLQLHSRQQWHTEANWKTILENYLECYHCPIAHPSFSAAINVEQDKYHLSAEGLVLSQLGQARAEAVKTKLKTYRAEGAIKDAQYHLLWPNFTININPGFPNLSIDVSLPDGPNKSRGFSEQYFAPGVDRDWAEELMEFNKQVGLEDDDLTNSVQRGLQGGIPAVGRLLKNSEHLIIHFQKLLLQAMTTP
jgi:phenylpropionate dioxygenase-like ring-hydroxylating dioxygenase large terminal subunit